MFSTETPPCSSCPCNSSALRTDGRSPDHLAFEKADPVTQAHSFSIRDYVFTSRSKDIATNWPFPRKFLQLCLKHGVKDPLPPFEPSDSLRAHCRKVVESDQPVNCSQAPNISQRFESVDIGAVCSVDDEPCDIKSKSCLRSNDLVVGCPKQDPLLEKLKQAVDLGDISDDETRKDNAEPISVVTNQDIAERISYHTIGVPCSSQATRSGSVASSEVETAQHDFVPLSQPSQKKRRLIVKLSAIFETRPTEDSASTSSTVSDPMVSKVCPVCKMFASSSNTTLNAHIDQCLSADSNIQQAVVETLKPKVKVTKKRLMVDIYATAPRCTLKDLDRRNGTNWASELSFMAPITEAPTENKKPKISPAYTRDDELPETGRDDGNEGAVYVDSNGIKLRILSKFNDTHPAISMEPLNSKELAENMKAGKSLLLSKKKQFASTYSKYMKVKPQIKKLSSFKLFKGEIQAAAAAAAPEGDHNTVPLQENGSSPSEISNAPNQIRNSCSAAIRQWVCSKRSDLPKKFNHKEIHNSEKSIVGKRYTLLESNQSDVGNSSVVESHNLKFSRTEENLTSSPKTKRVDFLSNTGQFMDNKKCAKPPAFNSKWSSESTSRSGLMLKISRSVEAPISSSRSRREETDKLGKSDAFCDTTLKPSKTGHPSLKAKRSSTMKKNDAFAKRSFLLDGSRNADNDKFSTNIKFRRHRSVPGHGKRERFPSGVKGCLNHSIKHYGADTAKPRQALHNLRSDYLEFTSRPATEVTMDKASPSSSNISESEEGEDVGIMENKKDFSLKWLHPDAEYSDLDMVTSNVHVNRSAHVATVSEPSIERVSDDLIIIDTVIPTNCAPPSIAKFDPKPAVDEHMQFSFGINVEQEAEKSPDEQELHKCNATHVEVVSERIKLADETGSGDKVDMCTAQYTECQAETAVAQWSSSCLTSHSDAMHEIPQDNSSITSVKKASDLYLHLAIEPSGSPISTASTISQSPKDSELKNLKEKHLVSSITRDKSGSITPCLIQIEGTEGRDMDTRNLEVEAFPQPKKPDQFSGDQPCCCSRREGLSRESQFMRKSIITGKTLPSMGKQITNLYISTHMPSSFSPYPRLRTDAIPVPVLESPTGSITSKALESAMKAPTSVDFSSPIPSPRTRTNSILRLMGKDLMVENNDELVEPPKVHHSAPDDSNAQRVLPTILGATGLESFSYHNHRLPGVSAAFGLDPSMIHQQLPLHSPTIQVGGFVGPVRAGLKMESDQQIHYNWNKMSNSPPVCHKERMVASHLYPQNSISSSQAKMSKEVIVIDDSLDLESESNYFVASPVNILQAISGSDPMQQRPLSCFDSQSQFLSRDVTSSFRPYPSAYPMDYANNTKTGRTLEGSDPLVSRPVVFQSPSTGHLMPSLYYSHMLR